MNQSNLEVFMKNINIMSVQNKINTNNNLFANLQLSAPKKLSTVTFAVTTDCNLSCKGCGRTKELLAGNWTNEHMTAHDFSLIMDNLPPMKTAMLQGIGEPTLNPDFFDICKIAKEKNKSDIITFHTNGITRDPEFLATLMPYIDWFAVSIDTLNEYYIENTRSGTSIKKLMSRLSEMNKLNLRFTVNMVASRKNYFDIPSTLKIINEVAPGRIVTVQPMESHDPEDQDVLSMQEISSLRELLNSYQNNLPNIKISFPKAGWEIKDNKDFCNAGAPAFSPYILPNGFITPCCRSNDASLMGYANLIDEKFEHIWNSDSVRSYVQKFIEVGDKNCDNCYERRRSSLANEPEFTVNEERAVNTLLPSVNFALTLNDVNSAIALCNEFLYTFPSSKQGNHILQQVMNLPRNA